MKAYGLQKTSLVNYPGKICTVIFTGGCNLRCKYCYNKDLVCNFESTKNSPLTEAEILTFLNKRKGLIDAVTVTGGEPTLQKDLLQFLQKIRELDFISIKLDTNGFLPEVVHQCLDKNLIDYVAVDIKTSPSKYKELTGVVLPFDNIVQTIGLLKSSSILFELRTTAIPDFLSLEDIQEIKEAVGQVPLYFLQQFVNENTLDTSFEKKYSFSKETLYQFEEKIKEFATHTGIKGV